MAITLNTQKHEYRSGKNILASSIVQYIHGGATLDGSAFPEGYIEVGTPIARNTTSGKYEPVAAQTAGYDNYYILNEDHKHDGVSDAVTGAVIIEGSVYEAKLPTEVDDTFKQANPNIHYVTNN